MIAVPRPRDPAYALQQSINIPSIKLLRKVGVSLVATYARRMGIKSRIVTDFRCTRQQRVTLLDLTTAYGSSRTGHSQRSALRAQVEDKNGTVLEKNSPRPVEGSPRRPRRS